jgi:peptide/nickel transport system permease protein
MIAAGQRKFQYWWAATFPGLAILSVVLGFNFLGDGLQDRLNPRLRRD